MDRRGWAVLIAMCLALSACDIAVQRSGPPAPDTEVVPMNTSSLRIASPAFSDGSAIPKKYTCSGANINPPLTIDGIPQGTKTLALIMDDPDAPFGTYTHWLLFNIPRTLKIEEDSMPIGAVPGSNSAQQAGYFGPCPPSGTHRYFFKLYALDKALALGKGANRDQLTQEMQGHILAEAKLMGTFQKG